LDNRPLAFKPVGSGNLPAPLLACFLLGLFAGIAVLADAKFGLGAFDTDFFA
jgi:hypothetical protein